MEARYQILSHLLTKAIDALESFLYIGRWPGDEQRQQAYLLDVKRVGMALSMHPSIAGRRTEAEMQALYDLLSTVFEGTHFEILMLQHGLSADLINFANGEPLDTERLSQLRDQLKLLLQQLRPSWRSRLRNRLRRQPSLV